MYRRSLFLLALPLLTACGITGSLRVLPQNKAKPVTPSFDQSFYYYDRDQTLFFVMRGTTTEAGKTEQQFLTIRVFWQPRGGVTTLDPSAINATFRYAVLRPDALAMYEGAGFVRLKDSDPGDGTFNAVVVDSDLRLTQASNSFVDTLGRARIAGNFSAVYDDVKAVDLFQTLQQEFFTRSLWAKPAATASATMP